MIAASLSGFVADKVPRTALAAVGAAVVAAGGLVLVAMSAALWMLGAGLVLVAIGSQLVLVPTIALISGIADEQSPPAYGAAYALYSIAYTTGLMIAPLLAAARSAVLPFAVCRARRRGPRRRAGRCHRPRRPPPTRSRRYRH
ncbi:hypothetical protein [Fodinicola feengrottensis]|uniref:hypothetical protein n=1 Tax=Fodinicola feengrottensis TaxID=435914 RepID=UPI0036F1A0EF